MARAVGPSEAGVESMRRKNRAMGKPATTHGTAPRGPSKEKGSLKRKHRIKQFTHRLRRQRRS